MLPRTCPKIVLLAAATLALCAPPAAAVGFGTPFTVAADNSPQHVAVGEFNGDSDPDLAVVNQSSSNVSILLGAAGGTFTGPVNYPVGLTPLALAVADFNGDSDPDLAVANEAANTVSVLLGGAGGTFSAPTDFAVGSTPQAVAARDFNGDSDPDLAVDREAIDRHARKLVAEKVRRDAQALEDLRRRPLSAVETLAVVLAVAALVTVAALALIAQR